MPLGELCTERGVCSRRGWHTRAPPTRPLDERAAEAEEEEEPVVESAALCVEGTCWVDQFLRMRRVIDSDHISEKPTENP
jgi:hypothetical protein